MLRKFAASASTAALSFDMIAAGAGVALAQADETPEAPSSGSLGADSLGMEDMDLDKMASDLGFAAKALNGPVSVKGNPEGGPTVAFTNESDQTMRCAGFTLPYSTIEENDIDPSDISLSDPFGALGLLNTIVEGDGVSAFTADAEGKPTANDVEPGDNQLVMLAISLVSPEMRGGIVIEPGAEVTWVTTAPEDPGAAAVLCAPSDGGELSDLAVEFGVDKQVIADQINGKLPGGSIVPVGPGSISGGSLAIGATFLGSIGRDASEGEDE